MHREHTRWYSPSLGRDMDMLVFGHGGARVLVFPTSMGRFYEWEDRGMIATLGDALDRGWLQLFCVDSVDAESWYAKHMHPGAMAWRHLQYLNYVAEEVLPFSRIGRLRGVLPLHLRRQHRGEPFADEDDRLAPLAQSGELVVLTVNGPATYFEDAHGQAAVDSAFPFELHLEAS